MRKARAFIEWLYGPLSDSYTWLIVVCIAGVLTTTGWRQFTVLGVEAITVAMRMWTRDVVAHKQEENE